METSYKVVGLISKVLKSSLAHSCHDVNVKNKVYNSICGKFEYFCRFIPEIKVFAAKISEFRFILFLKEL